MRRRTDLGFLLGAFLIAASARAQTLSLPAVADTYLRSGSPNQNQGTEPLLRIQASGGEDSWSETHDDIFTEEFLLTRPLLSAIRRDDPTVLLVDEVDKTDVEVEGLLLEVLSDFQVTIPELGTVTGTQIPLVFLTSNNTRELSEALKRRCLYLHVDYPDMDREKEIVLTKVPGVTDNLADKAKVRGIPLCDCRKRGGA